MDQLEQTILQRSQVAEEIEFLEGELEDLDELIAELSAAQSENSEYWSEPDEHGARVLLPAKAVYDQFINGTRAERYWAKTRPIFNNRIVASLTGNESALASRFYSEAWARNFGVSLVGAGFMLCECYEEDGEQIPGILIPVLGNYGPHRSTMILQDEWTQDGKIVAERARADALMVRMDRRYERAVKTHSVESFLNDWPEYVPES